MVCPFVAVKKSITFCEITKKQCRSNPHYPEPTFHNGSGCQIYIDEVIR